MNDKVTFRFYSENDTHAKIKISTTTEKAAIIKKFIDIVNDSENLIDALPKLIWEEDIDNEIFSL